MISKTILTHIRGRSDKYLDSSRDVEIYYHVVYSRRRLLSKFQTCLCRSSVLTTYEGVFANFRKMEKDQYRSVIRFMVTVRLLLWRKLTNIGLTSDLCVPQTATTKNSAT